MSTIPRMTKEAQAREAGFTREVMASSSAQDLNLLVAPDSLGSVMHTSRGSRLNSY